MTSVAPLARARGGAARRAAGGRAVVDFFFRFWFGRGRRRRVSNGVAGGPHPDRHSNVMAFGPARAEGSSLWNTASALTLQVKGGRDDLSGEATVQLQ